MEHVYAEWKVTLVTEDENAVNNEDNNLEKLARDIEEELENVAALLRFDVSGAKIVIEEVP